MDKTHSMLKHWSTLNENSKKLIKADLESFKDVKDDVLTAALEMETKIVFSQFNCLQCANCCKTTPPIFLNSDVKRIAKAMKIPPKIFIRKYLIEDVDGTLIGNGVPCHFLNKNNTCDIYEFRPKACQGFPHMDEKRFKYRNKINYKNTEICPAALKIVENVKSRLKT